MEIRFNAFIKRSGMPVADLKQLRATVQKQAVYMQPMFWPGLASKLYFYSNGIYYVDLKAGESTRPGDLNVFYNGIIYHVDMNT